MKRQFRNRVFGLAAGTVAFGVISACGGAGGGGLDVADGGIRGTGSSVGPVSGFGSVFVNGVKFSTDRNVSGDDGINQEDRLVVGMILRVEGEWGTSGLGDAESVEYDDTLRGTMQVLNPWDPVNKTATIKILEQTVSIDSQTVVKGIQVSNLTSGSFVRMSGWRLPNGEFRASYLGIQTSSNSDDFDALNKVELEGVISDFTETDFRIGSQVVNYSGATPDGLVLAELANGVAVEVEGSLSGSTLMAQEIRPDDSRRYRPGTEDETEFVGPVSAAYSQVTGSFTVNGVPVQVTNDTEFDGLTGPDDLVQGVLVQVDGRFESDGSVTAEEIESREADSEVQGGPAQEINSSLSQFKVGGVLVQVTPLTIITDDDDTRLSFWALEANSELEIDGIQRVSDTGQVFLEALKIERDDDSPGDSFELTGRVSEMVGDRIQVLGVDLVITNDTEFDDISRGELQGLVDDDERPKPKVEVEYEAGDSSSHYVISEIELEEDDDD
ncbi:DUF5666 domain-containing protein [Marinobacter sp. 1_MG-2023]|uniref:DUF5666 domain-containing protein n=1 Tax=Marinobacter sp. 1_MG-2023 TaxID=3062627 RepID=UPI0026E3BA88|nr:DUF5666 domain-containing protein [Marinobacter sp. 1_MG-2023]MDO6823006.1 DUF5666 domain-containing protein [Marinobacter sp. 1_MG-2023]